MNDPATFSIHGTISSSATMESDETDRQQRPEEIHGEEDESYINVDALSQRSLVIEEKNEAESTKETAEGDDDDLRRMMADLREESPPTAAPSSVSGIVKEEKILVDRPVEINTGSELTGDLPAAQSSPSYAAAKWAAKLGSGAKSTSAIAPSSALGPSSNKSWRDDFVAAVQANKLKRKAAAAAAGKPKKKKRKFAGKGRVPSKKRALDDSFDNSSVGSSSTKRGRKVRATEFTPKEKESLKAPLRQGWKREMVYRKTQKKGSTADIYYIAPNGIRLRSMPEVDDYLRTASEKVTRDNFSFRRFVIGFDEIPDIEIIRGSLAPELAALEEAESQAGASDASPGKAMSSPTLKRAKKKLFENKTGSAPAKKSKLSEIAVDGGERSSDDDAGSKKSSVPRPLTLMSFSKRSPSSKQRPTSASISTAGAASLSVAANPKKKLAAASSVSAQVGLEKPSVASKGSRMHKLRKVAITESQRQRNALLKSITTNSIPAIEDYEVTSTTSKSIKSKAGKIISSSRNADGSSHASSTRDGSETSSEQDFRVATCDDTCPVRDSKWPAVPCISCLRLFHKDCLAAKGRILSSLQFECSECTQFPADQHDEGSALDTELRGGIDGSFVTSRKSDDIAMGPASSGNGERPLAASTLVTGSVSTPSVPAAGLPACASSYDLSSASLSDSNFSIAPAADRTMALADRVPCRSPPLDMAVTSDNVDAPTLEIIANGKETMELTDSGQASPVAFPVDRFNDYIRGLVSIFKHLPVRDLLNVRLVCKAWNVVSFTPEVWKYARLKGCRVRNDDHSWSVAIEFLRKRCVEELDLAGCTAVSMSQFIGLVLPALSRFVSGFHFGQILPKLMESTAKLCGEKLRSVTVTLVKDAFSSTDWISSTSFSCFAACTELTELRLSAADPSGRRRRVYINGDGLSALASLTKLRVLALFDVRAVDEKVFNFLDSLTALRILEIGDCQCWTRETYSKLRRFTKLRRLRLEYLEPGAAGDVLAESLLPLKDLREAEFVRYSFDYSYMSALAAQPLLALTALPHLHTLRLYPDLDGKWPAPTWRRTVDVIPHCAGLKRLELGLMMAENSAPPADFDLKATLKPPFMCNQPKQQQRIAYLNKEALKEWIAEKLPNTVVNVGDFLSSELATTRLAKWW